VFTRIPVLKVFTGHMTPEVIFPNAFIVTVRTGIMLFLGVGEVMSHEDMFV